MVHLEYIFSVFNYYLNFGKLFITNIFYYYFLVKYCLHGEQISELRGLRSMSWVAAMDLHIARRYLFV